MDIYCMKEQQATPNVPGTDKVVTTKNGRKMLKETCASCSITKTRFLQTDKKGAGLPIPFPFVDWKKAWKVVTALGLFKGPDITEEKGKRRAARYKIGYREYKHKGGSWSYGSRMKWKDYAE